MADKKQRSLIILGIFTICSIGLMFYLSLKVGGIDVEERKVYYAEFADATGLVARAGIKVSGIDVGSVGTMHLTDKNRARIELRVDRGIKIYQDARVAIRAKSLLGEMFIGLFPGTPETGELPAGSDITRATEPLRVADLGELIAPFIQDIDAKAFGEALGSLANFLSLYSDQFSSAGQDALELLSRMNRILRENERPIGRMVQSGDEVAGQLAKFIREHGDDLGKTITSLTQTSQRIEKLVASLETVTNEQERSNIIKQITELIERANRLSRMLEENDWDKTAMILKKIVQQEGITVSILGYDDQEIKDQMDEYRKLHGGKDNVK